jgi:hypothetical protein
LADFVCFVRTPNSEITENPSPEKGNMLKGMKIRDEFLCPITCELLREPVVAMDGHTYEKNAIERWFSTHRHSPKSGQPIETNLISNLNLKRIIQDMINEGGASLYTYDANYRSRLINVSAQKLLSMKCLGPPESDWYLKAFDVREFPHLRSLDNGFNDAFCSTGILNGLYRRTEESNGRGRRQFTRNDYIQRQHGF